MPAEFISIKGKQILFADYSSCENQEEIFELLNITADILLKYDDGKALVLVDFTNQHGSRDYMKKAKEFSSLYGHKIRKRAVLGITGMKKVLLLGYNKFSGNLSQTVPFDSKEEALDYLIQ